MPPYCVLLCTKMLR